jgi:hypothetical protein
MHRGQGSRRRSRGSSVAVATRLSFTGREENGGSRSVSPATPARLAATGQSTPSLARPRQPAPARDSKLSPIRVARTHTHSAHSHHWNAHLTHAYARTHTHLTRTMHAHNKCAARLPGHRKCGHRRRMRAHAHKHGGPGRWRGCRRRPCWCAT